VSEAEEADYKLTMWEVIQSNPRTSRLGLFLAECQRRWEVRDGSFGRWFEQATAHLFFAWGVGEDGKRVLLAYGASIEEVHEEAMSLGGYREISQGFGDPVFLDFLDKVFGD